MGVVEQLPGRLRAGPQDLRFCRDCHRFSALSKLWDARLRPDALYYTGYGGYSSVAERRSVAADVVGSKPTSRPNHPSLVSPAPAKKTKAPVLYEAPAAPARLFAGTSGWAYTTWKPGFYPPGVSSKNFLAFYASRLTTCEVNYTFRKLPTPAQVAEWLAQVAGPQGERFRFSFKAPQRITHYSRLRDCGEHVAEFYAALKPVAKAGKLGLILYQLPPNLKANLPLLRDFLALKCLRGKAAPPIAFEFRHASWFTPETENALRKAGAAFCIAETDDLTTPELHTAVGHTCFRLRQGGGYSPAQLAALAARIAPLARDRDVYVHFKHEDEPTGALNAAAFLAEAMRLERGEG